MEDIGNIVKKGRIEDKQMYRNEEHENEDCDLESKIEVVDDMLAVYKTESADLAELLQETTKDYVPEDQKSLEKERTKESKQYTQTDTSKVSQLEGTIYPCDQCEYVATQQGNLNSHKQKNHKYELHFNDYGQNDYSCDQCQCVYTHIAALIIHMKLAHKVQLITEDKTAVKDKEITEEEDYGEEPPVKKEEIEEDEQITVKEELEDEDCDLESKIEVVDEMLAVYKTESADLTEFLEDNNEDLATEELKRVEEPVVKN